MRTIADIEIDIAEAEKHLDDLARKQSVLQNKIESLEDEAAYIEDDIETTQRTARQLQAELTAAIHDEEPADELDVQDALERLGM